MRLLFGPMYIPRMEEASCQLRCLSREGSLLPSVVLVVEAEVVDSLAGTAVGGEIGMASSVAVACGWEDSGVVELGGGGAITTTSI